MSQPNTTRTPASGLHRTRDQRVGVVREKTLGNVRRKADGQVFRDTVASGKHLPERPAFTLLELMLVLAIMTVIAAIAVPSLGEIYQRQQLRAATSGLRMRWDEARLEAMRTGQAQVFECTLQTGQFSVKPLVLGADAVSSGPGAIIQQGGVVSETNANGLSTAPTEPLDEAEELENEITFHACIVAGDARAFSVAQESESTQGTLNDLSTQTVAQKVIFYPDGSTSTAEVQIQNKRGDIQAVQIRGLTGHTRLLDVSSVPSEETK